MRKRKIDLSIYDLEDEPSSGLLVEKQGNRVMYDIRSMSKRVKELGRMLTVKEMEQFKIDCSTCKNNIEYPTPHTCDVCTGLDEEEYSMWEAKE